MANDAESAGDLEEARVSLVSPAYMIVDSTTSRLGPATIAPGREYTFDIHYDIDPAAPYGCFRAFLKLAVPENAIFPDPENDPNPIDFIVLPSTDSRGGFWAKRRALRGCRENIESAEAPTQMTECRHSIAEALDRIRTSTAAIEPLVFSERDRTRRTAPTKTVLAEARSGSIPAVLELGFRRDPKSKRFLRTLTQPPEQAALLASIGERVWECDELLRMQIDKSTRLILAARQALARRGDNVELAFFKTGLAARDADVVLRSIAALGYIGGEESTAALAAILSHPGLEKEGRFRSISYPAMLALASLHPELAREIERASAGPEDKLRSWQEWARASGLCPGTANAK